MYWPVRELKWLARLPHDYQTWLSSGHTVPNGDPPEPFAPDTQLCAWLILPPIGDPDMQSFTLSGGNIINLYVVHGLFKDELEFKLNEGTAALLDRFDAAELTEVLDPRRNSVIPRKRFGFFGR